MVTFGEVASDDGFALVRRDDATIEVTGVDALYEQLREHAHPNAHVHDTEWDTREFAVLDPDGNLVTFWERRS